MFLNKTKQSKAAAATVTSLIAASSAQGIIQYFDTSNEFSVGFGSTGTTLWNVDDNGTVDGIWNVGGSGGSIINLYGSGGYLNGLANPIMTSRLSNVPVNYTVSASKQFDDQFTLIQGNAFDDLSNFNSAVSGYFGFHFITDPFNPGPKQYGWARATFYNGTNPGGSGVTIHEWAYEDTPDQAIQVGAIPEPAAVATGLGALALGAAGLRRWRKAKRTS
ncbi:hypothetical protein [Rubellicoccus peritrichatus]|uniref:PEP-CTERM protein-sorting domain-containing protein n=1 Tax=Rubellicoccus peritrichatus TaxID=3080537 RepID=A0AAQ3L9J6_9BACT|nr:hypothetical protein [Puniceicoccus sp. CR14]WOO39820.1 hypothetical protein RZN69_14440 [Puniceicoccus sp. CR14]